MPIQILNKEAIARIVQQTVGTFDEHAEDLLGAVGARSTDHPLDEPANLAHRMAGIACLAEQNLKLRAVEGDIPAGRDLGRAILNRPNADFDEREERRLAAAVLEGLKRGASAAEPRFRSIAAHRERPLADRKMEEGYTSASIALKSSLAQHRIGDEVASAVFEQLKTASPGEELLMDVSEMLDPVQVAPSLDLTALRALVSSLENRKEAAPKNKDKLFSELWPMFSAFQVEGGH